MDLLQNIEQLLGRNWQSAGLIVFNLIIIESMLSIDNAAVLATMVMPLPPDQRRKALRIGLILAYVFRGTCLVLASILIKIKWLKMIGGLYLIYLAADYFFSHDDVVEHPENFTPKSKIKWLSPFWGTVVMVETMDLMFSIDNVFAAVAFTDNIYLICTGVFIGIIAMRTVAVYFVKLMEKYPNLSTAAFLVIAVLGLKLFFEALGQYWQNPVSHLLEYVHADLYFSISTLLIFVIFIFVPTKK